MKISLFLNKFFVWARKHWKILLILTITLLAYGQSIKMYFWVDDWGLAYKMIFPYDAPNPSNFGGGFWGSGAYRHNATPFIFLYPLFGLSAPIYFALGILQYFLLAWLVYRFLEYISQNETIALLAGVIFASGYIGSYAIYRLSNSYQLIETAIFSILTVWSFIKHFRTGKSVWYWLSLLLFISTIELFFLRAHGIILLILISFVFLVGLRKVKIKLFTNIAKLIPFILLYYFFYVVDYRGGIESGVNNSANYISTLFKTLVIDENWKLLNNLIASFGNLIVPLPVTEILYKHVGHYLFYSVESISKYIGAVLLLGMGLVMIIAIKARRNEWKLIPLSILWVFSNIIIYFVYMPTSTMVSNSRYAIPAFVGSSMASATFLYLIFTKKLAIIFTIILSLTYLYLTNMEESYIVRHVSTPDKQGYTLIKKDVPSIDKDTLFYVETIDDPVYKSNFLGNIPNLGISSIYRYHGSTKIALSYNQVFEMLINGLVDIDKTYTFFFSRNGYTNTTNKFIDILKNGNKSIDLIWKSLTPKTETFVYQRDFGMVGVNPTIEMELDYPSLTPSFLTIDMAISSYGLENITYPYLDLSEAFAGQGIKELNLMAIPQPDVSTVDITNIHNILKLTKERNEFIENTRITTTNYEQNKKSEFLIDGTNLFGWEANYIFWGKHGTIPEEIIIDLGKEQFVNKLYWINHSFQATPVNYSISMSKNNKDWSIIKEIINGKGRENFEMVGEELAVYTRYIKIDIYKTQGEYVAPAIDELWTSKYDDSYSLSSVASATTCPFCLVPDKKFAQSIIDVENGQTSGKVWWMTDGQDDYSPPYSKEIQFNLDGKVHKYVIQIPASGSNFRKIKIGNFPTPVIIKINEVSIKNMSLKEINHP